MTGNPTRFTAVAGCAFAVLFTGGFVALGEIWGSFGDPDETFIEYYESSGNRLRDIAGVYLMSGAALAFTIFALGMAQRLQRPEPSLSPTALTAMAVLFATCLAISASLLGAVALSRAMADVFDDSGVLEGAEAAVAPQAGYVILAVPGAMMAGATVFGISLASWKYSSLPRWVCVFGLAAGPLIFLLAFAGPPFILLPAWVLAASIAIGRAGPEEPAAGA